MMKYILLIIMTGISFYPVSKSLTWKSLRKLLRLNRHNPVLDVHTWKDVCSLGSFLLFLVCVLTICVTRNDEVEAEQKETRLNARILEQTELMKSQVESIQVLSRTAGSIAFNTRTSYAGKARFVEAFKRISAFSGISDDSTGFEGLICGDGVGLFWFDAETESITGFRFFPNNEINMVLSGFSLDDHFIGNGGVVTIPSSNELAIAFSNMLFKELPRLRGNTVEDKLVLARVQEAIETQLRYVYRADNVRFGALHKDDDMHTDTGDFICTFQYVVDPSAKSKKIRNVGPIFFTKSSLESFCGMSHVEFSQKLIARLRNEEMEPKVSLKIIRGLNRRRENAVRMAETPFDLGTVRGRYVE